MAKMNGIDELVSMMTKLSVADELRKKKQMSMPEPELVIEFEDLAFKLMKRVKFGRSEK